MSSLSFSTRVRSIRRWLRRKRNRPTVAAISIVTLCIAVLGYTYVMEPRRLTVDPASYTPLLELIARVESKGNYNAHFGNAANTSIDFTRMSIAQVQAWQAEHVRQGNPSSAVGRYQIISTTLSDLVQRLQLDTTQPFAPATQDTLAIALLERRGAERYINKELTAHEFAANLAKEWAALPKAIGPDPHTSYYAADGLNQALVGVEEVVKAVQMIKPKA